MSPFAPPEGSDADIVRAPKPLDEASVTEPLMLIPHVPDAPAPERDGASNAVRAAAAELAPVPPLATGNIPLTFVARFALVR